MTPSSKFLDYEVVLLLAKYGEAALLTSLAKHLHLTLEELDALLQNAPNSKEARPKKKPTSVELLTQLAQAYPNKAELLRTLNNRFGNRTFLPELRDVKQFFEQHDRPLGGSRSRADALPRLLKLLSEFDVSDLQTLCQTRPENTYSSLGVISDEILRRNR